MNGLAAQLIGRNQKDMHGRETTPYPVVRTRRGYAADRSVRPLSSRYIVEGMPQPIDVHDQASYDALQAKLIPLWKSIEHLNTDEQTIVVVPSAHVDVELTASQLQAYEERYLFLLFLLRQPRARMVYVTGQAIHPDIIDYYLDLMPGVIRSHARSRLFFVSPMEATDRALSDNRRWKIAPPQSLGRWVPIVCRYGYFR